MKDDTKFERTYNKKMLKRDGDSSNDITIMNAYRWDLEKITLVGGKFVTTYAWSEWMVGVVYKKWWEIWRIRLHSKWLLFVVWRRIKGWGISEHATQVPRVLSSTRSPRRLFTVYNLFLALSKWPCVASLTPHVAVKNEKKATSQFHHTYVLEIFSWKYLSHSHKFL